MGSINFMITKLLSSIVLFTIRKSWKVATEGSKRAQQKIQSNIERTKKITDIRNQFFEKVFQKFDSIKDFPTNPMNRIHGEYSKVNIKDVNDDKFPHSDYMSKYEVFDFKEEGIEVLGSDNILGFNLLIDDEYNWGVLGKFDKPKKGKYTKPKQAYSVCFISYEDVLHIDWEKDSYGDNITISCHFKYKNHMRHPFREFRYYIETTIGFRQLIPENKRNFARFDFFNPFKVYAERVRSHRFKRKIKEQKRLWK